MKEASGRGYLPRPGGTSTADVLANLKAGMERMKITSQPDWKALYDDFGHWETFRLARVVAVKSLALNHPDYFIVLVNDAQNRRYAAFCVSAEGWLMEWEKTGQTPVPESISAADVDRILTRHGITAESSGRDYVFAINSLPYGWLRTAPMARIVRGSHTYYVHGNGNVYEEAAPEEQDTDGHMYKLGPKVRLKQVR